MRRHLLAAVSAMSLTGALAVAALGFTSAPAVAAPPTSQGWWTSTNPLPAPDVPSQGLLVQAGPGGGAPSAYAALMYELDPGTSAQTLTLTVAPGSLTTPSATLQLCQLLQPINHPEQGGPLTDAPPYNCGRQVTAKPSADGKSYQFDASGMVVDGLVAVAILPTGPVDRVVFNTPDANSLATAPGAGGTTAAGTDTGVTAPAAEPLPASATPEGLSAAPFVAAPATADTFPPGTGPAPAAVPRAPVNNNQAGVFLPAVSTHPDGATPVLVLLLVAGGVGGAFLWFYAGRQSGDAVIGP